MIEVPTPSLQLFIPEVISAGLRELVLDASPVLRVPKRVDAYNYPDIEWMEVTREDGSVVDVPRVRGVKFLYSRGEFPFECRLPAEDETDDEVEARRHADLRDFRQLVEVECRVNTEAIGRLLGLSLMAGKGGDNLVGVHQQIRAMVRLSRTIDDLMLLRQIERMVYMRRGTHVIVGREVTRRLWRAHMTESSAAFPSDNRMNIYGAEVVTTNDAAISHTITIVNANEWLMHDDTPLTFEPLPYDPLHRGRHSFLLKTYVASMLTDTYTSHGMIILN